MEAVQPLILRRYVTCLVAGWTVAVSALLVMTLLQERNQTMENARTEARSNIQRDISYREWNSSTGSLYAQVSKLTPPNPFLSNVVDRDVTTTGGKKLTLVNPAYMSRLVFDLTTSRGEPAGHICSLRPVRPQNRPDAWEAEALRAFERGEKEATTLERRRGESYLRMMIPLLTGQQCLRCHAKDGYRLGDVRGGISVAVPMAPLWNVYRRHLLVYCSSFVFLWLAGLTAIFWGASRMHDTIRQRNKAEQEVAELNESLLALTAELQGNNRELESFCATVCHDLRSPLTAIIGYSHLLNELPPQDYHGMCLQFSNTVNEQAARMDRMIDALMEFSRLTSGEVSRSPVELGGIVAELAATLRHSSPGRSVSFAIQRPAWADCDEELIRVVLQNLVGNAWKYTARREDALVEFGTLETEHGKTFFLRDNGIGFEDGDKARMFQPFKRLSNSGEFEGNGIGLSTVKRIITRHGGRIWCQGALGEGASFFFTLPPRQQATGCQEAA